MPKPSDPSVENVGTLTGTESIPLDNGTSTALKTTPADIKTYVGGLVLGTTAGTACEGNDSRLSDARTPTAHATSHIADTGSDALHAYDVNGMSYHGFFARDMTAGVTPATKGPLPIQITSTTFTLYGSRSTIVYYYQATKVTVSTDKTATLDDGAGGSTAGLYFVYFNGATGNILCTKVFPGLTSTSNVIIATITWNGTNLGWVNDERHGYLRNGVWHLWAHQHVGATYGSGIVLTTTNSGAGLTFATTSGDIDDEDISFVVDASSAFPTPNTCKLIRQTAATVYSTENTVSTKPFYWNGGTTRVQYVNAAGPYTLVDAGSARFVNVWLYASTDLHTPIVAIAETIATATTGYTTAALARAILPPNLGSLQISPEMKLLYRLIMTGAGTVSEVTDYRNSSPVASGGSASTSAAAVSFTPTAPLTNVTVQGAIDQLQTLAGLLDRVQTWTAAQAGEVTALSVSANAIAIDLAASNNFSVTLQATTGQTLSAPSNPVAGQSGVIAITQNATPSTLAYNAFWKFSGGVVPVVSGANAVDIFTYYVIDANKAICSLIKGVA